jgi:hypothetical protein
MYHFSKEFLLMMKKNLYLTLALLMSSMQLFGAATIQPSSLPEEPTTTDIEAITQKVTQAGSFTNLGTIKASWKKIRDKLVADTTRFWGKRTPEEALMNNDGIVANAVYTGSITNLATALYLAHDIYGLFNNKVNTNSLARFMTIAINNEQKGINYAGGTIEARRENPRVPNFGAKIDMLNAYTPNFAEYFKAHFGSISGGMTLANLSKEITDVINPHILAAEATATPTAPAEAVEEAEVTVIPPSPAGTSGGGAAEEAADEEATRQLLEQEATAEAERRAQEAEDARLAEELAREGQTPPATPESSSGTPTEREEARLAKEARDLAEAAQRLAQEEEARLAQEKAKGPTVEELGGQPQAKDAILLQAIEQNNLARVQNFLKNKEAAQLPDLIEFALLLAAQKENIDLNIVKELTQTLTGRDTFSSALQKAIAVSKSPKVKEYLHAKLIVSPEFAEEIKKRAGRPLTQQNIRQIWAEIKPGGTPLSAGEVEQLVAYATADWRASKDQALSHLGRVSTQLIRSRKDAIEGVEGLSQKTIDRWNDIASGR